MALAFDHFWSQVLRRAAETVGDVVCILQHLGETVVDDLDVAVLVDKDVFQLQIAVNDALGMQVPDRHRQLGRVEPDSLLVEPLLLLVNFVQLTASNEGHDEIEPELVLEEELHADQEGVVALEHDVLLEESALDLVHLNQHIFPDRLDGVQLLVDGQFCQEHLAKRASSQHHQQVEVLELDLLQGLCQRSSAHDDLHILVVIHLLQSKLPLFGLFLGDRLFFFELHGLNVACQVVVEKIYLLDLYSLGRRLLETVPVLETEVVRILVLLCLLLFQLKLVLGLDFLLLQPVLLVWFVFKSSGFNSAHFKIFKRRLGNAVESKSTVRADIGKAHLEQHEEVFSVFKDDAQ